MNSPLSLRNPLFFIVGVLVSLTAVGSGARAQTFDFARLEQEAREFTVIVKMKIEISFGMQTNEQEERSLGTIVTEDGLFVFNGSSLATQHSFSSMAGLTMKTTPTKIEVTTLDNEKYQAEYVGLDRFTKLAFARISMDKKPKFKPVRFPPDQQFKVGSWLALYSLLPEFVTPPITADIGMVSSLVESPEKFPLTVGFNPTQMSCVLFDEKSSPVGLLGMLMDPTSVNTDAGGMIESFSQYEIPLMGVITGERVAKMISVPPKKGEMDRAWLGISLQALTKDIAEFLGITSPGGIIVNDVMKNSPAKKGGLAVSDVIVQVNGQPIDIDAEEKVPFFQRRIAEMSPGSTVEFLVLRFHDHAIDTIKIATTLEAAPLAATDAPVYENKTLELKVRNLVFGDYMALNVDVGSLTGVMVSELKSGGLASVGGLEMGDVVQRINETAIASVDDSKLALEKVEKEKPREIIFFVWRDNKTMFVNVKTDWKQP